MSLIQGRYAELGNRIAKACRDPAPPFDRGAEGFDPQAALRDLGSRTLIVLEQGQSTWTNMIGRKVRIP